MTEQSTSYDLVAYPGQTQKGSHPHNIAIAARLLGVAAPAPETARVLELACGHGINLMWIAQTVPGATCTGLDLAASGIERGNTLARTAGIGNVHLRQGDLMEVGASIGEFDYIIAHGVYAWVPEAVREQIMRICSRCLAPDGIAYVSYNTYPGNHIYEVGRRLMRMFAEQGANPRDRIARARTILRHFAETAIEDDDMRYCNVLRGEHQRVAAIPDYLLYHDDLSVENHPVYFADFAAHAQRHGLRYLCEGDLADFTFRSGIIAQGNEISRIGRNRIEREQFYDIRIGRSFRQSLLTRHAPADDIAPVPGALRHLRLLSDVGFDIDGPADLLSDKAVEFRPGRGLSATSKVAHVKAALAALSSAWPASLAFDELCAGVAVRLACPREAGFETAFATGMMQAAASGLIEFAGMPDTWVTVPGERPRIHPLALALARDGQSIPTLRGRMMSVDEDLVRPLVQALDGTRTKEELSRLVATRAAGLNGAPPGDPAQIGRNVVNEMLGTLARAACLIA